MMALLRQVVDPGTTEGRYWAMMRMHRITSDLMVELGASSKLNAEWPFLMELFEEGRRSATRFADDHRDAIGVTSTLDIEALVEGT